MSYEIYTHQSTLLRTWNERESDGQDM